MWSRYSRLISQRSSTDDGKPYRDLLETHNQSLGYTQLEKVKIDCSFLPSSKWGFLGSVPGEPAWLLYLQLQFSQPDGYKLANATVELTFGKVNAFNKEPIYRSKPGPVLTEYYGPRDVRRSHFIKPKKSVVCGDPGASITYSSEVSSEDYLDVDGQWSLHGYTWPAEGDDSGLHRRAEWSIKEACPPYQTILHHDQVRVGLILRHDSDPFLITVRIHGQLQGNHGWFKFPSSAEPRTKSICVRVSPSAHNLAPLDDIAKRLNNDMIALVLRNFQGAPVSSKRPGSEDHPDIDSKAIKKQRVQPPPIPPPLPIAQALPKGHEDYTIGWVCALPIEMAAARMMLDRTHLLLPTPLDDQNNYILGNIGPHNIVVACLPAGVYGNTSATTVVSHMITTFPSIRIGLMVGIGGGVPSSEADIRLGDVVVSKPTGTLGGVVQYDFGKTTSGGEFKQTGALNKPPQLLLSTTAKMQAEHIVCGDKMADYLGEMVARFPRTQNFTHPGQEHDCLFNSGYDHCGSSPTCQNCDPAQYVKRQPRARTTPAVHYGIIASGNRVMKHGKTRDRIAKEHGIICFEMEAAGIMDNFPCLVIRGICDYADSHKNDNWHNYAAATAAAYAKQFISMTPVRHVKVTPKVTEV